MRNKRGVKGQITVFVILGIIILFSVGTLLYIQATKKTIPTAFELSSDPVEAYIQSCLVDVTKEAVQIAGQQGGYIFIDPLSAEQQEVFELLPFSSDVLLLAGGKQQLPYWYYQRNDGIDRVAIPELYRIYAGDNSIQDQIERYVTQQLPTCLNDFESLAMDVSYAGEFWIDSNIGEESIEVIAHMPVTINEGGSGADASAQSQRDEFRAVTMVGLKPTYELAREIAEFEVENLFLEQETRNLLAIYGQVDSAYLPPMAGGLHFEACANREHWFYSDVEQNVQQMLAANIPYIQIGTSDFTPYVVSSGSEEDEDRRELRQAVFDGLVQYPTKNKYEGIMANLQYQTNFPLHLQFGNDLGYGLIQPDALEINVLVANFCMFDYSFLYNIKYPVLVSLMDTQGGIDGNPFMFQFPMQVVIKNNYPRVRLNDVLADQIQFPAPPVEPTWQCDPQQRLSAPSTVHVKNIQDMPVGDAVVSFQCGPNYVYQFDENGTVTNVESFAKTCFMGTTDDAGKLTTNFPPCIGGGILTVQHEEYVEQSTPSGDIRQNEAFEKSVTLDKVYTKNIQIEKYYTGPASETNDEGVGIILNEEGEIVACNILMEKKPFQPYESAILTLTKVHGETGEFMDNPIVIYDPSAATNSETGEVEPITLDIAPGTYNVDIMLLREERYPGEMTIEANSQTMEVQGTLEKKEITYPEEDLLIPQTFTGGAVFEWTVSAAMLESGDTITFTVFDEGEPKRVEDVAAPLAHRETCSALQPSAVQPKVS